MASYAIWENPYKRTYSAYAGMPNTSQRSSEEQGLSLRPLRLGFLAPWHSWHPRI
jgi:hypothetical protein